MSCAIGRIHLIDLLEMLFFDILTVVANMATLKTHQFILEQKQAITWFRPIHTVYTHSFSAKNFTEQQNAFHFICLRDFWFSQLKKMSTVASALSIAGSRSSGAPVRTQNGKNLFNKLQWNEQMSAANFIVPIDVLVINCTRYTLIK